MDLNNKSNGDMKITFHDGSMCPIDMKMYENDWFEIISEIEAQ